MKKLVLAPVCITVLAYAVMATQSTPSATKAEDLQSTPVAEASALDTHEHGHIDGEILGGGAADVICGDITGPWRWGNVGDTTGYSIGTSSCNIGNVNLNWIENSDDHPVIAQNMYRLNDGILEQIGVGWLKHSFCALQLSGLCQACQNPFPGCPSFLGPGCNDPYTAQRNGGQPRLGPRFEVNAFTGVFPWPHTARGVSGNKTYKRIQVKLADVDAANYPNATFYGEGQYVAFDDSQAGNQFNNATHKRMFRSNNTGDGWNFFFTGTPTRVAAIYAWESAGATVQEVFVPGEGLLNVGYNVTDNGDGTFHYEYAVHNQNSHRSVGSFSVPVSDLVAVNNIGFHDVNYHSGEPYDGTDWPGAHAGGEVSWATDSFFTNQNANAIRWGTMYNFRFDSPNPPEEGVATLGMFRPGVAPTVTVNVMVPAAPTVLIGDMNCDGVVSVGDINAFVLALTDARAYENAFPDCNILNGDCNDDGNVTVGDINCFVALVTGG